MKPKNLKMKMLETVDVIELSNRFTLDAIADTFNCSTQFVRNVMMRQELKENTTRDELGDIKESAGAWKDLKNTELYQRLMKINND